MDSSNVVKVLKETFWDYYINKCPICQAIFFSKDKNKKTCGSYACEGKFCFLEDDEDYSERSHVVYNSTIRELYRQILKHFKTLGYTNLPPKKVTDSISTIFVTAGIQVIIENLKDNIQESEKYIIAQPSIRSQFIDLVGKTEGYLTSFVNMALYTSGTSSSIAKAYAEMTKDLISFLERYDINDIRLKVKVDKARLPNGKYPGFFLRLNTGGLELCDAGLIMAEDYIVDVGFGLERIAWSITRVPSMFFLIGPLSEALLGNYKGIDILRTLTLIFGCSPLSREQITKTRSIIRGLLDQHFVTLDILSLIIHYYKFWKNFIKLNLRPSEIKEKIIKEFENIIINELCNMINIQKNKVKKNIKQKYIRMEDINDFLESIMSYRDFPIHKLRIYYRNIFNR